MSELVKMFFANSEYLLKCFSDHRLTDARRERVSAVRPALAARQRALLGIPGGQAERARPLRAEGEEGMVRLLGRAQARRRPADRAVAGGELCLRHAQSLKNQNKFSH